MLKVAGQAFVKPCVIPPRHCHQVTKPLQSKEGHPTSLSLIVSYWLFARFLHFSFASFSSSKTYMYMCKHIVAMTHWCVTAWMNRVGEEKLKVTVKLLWVDTMRVYVSSLALFALVHANGQYDITELRRINVMITCSNSLFQLINNMPDLK